MIDISFTLATVIGSIVWLVLLVATGFNSFAVGVGLLGVLVVTGRASDKAS